MSAHAKEVADTLPLDGFPPEIVDNIAIINKAESWLQTIEQEYSNVPDVETNDGMATAREWRRNLVTARTQGNNARLAAGRPLTEMKKRIDDTWKQYEPRIKALEDPLDAAIKAVEEAAERKKEAKRQEEAKRVTAIEDLIVTIRASPTQALTLEHIDEELAWLDSIDLADFDEHVDAGKLHIESARTALEERRGVLQEQAEEAKRIVAARIEQEARQKELDAQQEAMEERQRKLDEQVAKMERRQREQEEREAAEVRRKEQEEHDRIAAEQKAIADKEAAELAAKLAEEQRIQAEKDAAEKAKRDEEAAEAEAERIAALAPEAAKIRAYLKKVMAVKMPGVESDEAVEVLSELHDAYMKAERMIDWMQA